MKVLFDNLNYPNRVCLNCLKSSERERERKRERERERERERLTKSCYHKQCFIYYVTFAAPRCPGIRLRAKVGRCCRFSGRPLLSSASVQSDFYDGAWVFIRTVSTNVGFVRYISSVCICWLCSLYFLCVYMLALFAIFPLCVYVCYIFISSGKDEVFFL